MTTMEAEYIVATWKCNFIKIFKITFYIKNLTCTTTIDMCNQGTVVC